MLAAVGAAFFALAVLRPLAAGRELMRRHALLLGGSFLIAFVGADALIRATAGSATRFERVLVVAAVARSSARRRRRPRSAGAWAIYVAWAAAAILVRLPHARRPRARRATSRVVLAPARRPAARRRRRGLDRRARLARCSLFPCAGRDGARGRRAALLELRDRDGARARRRRRLEGADASSTRSSQLWETSYGRTLLVKIGLLAVLLVLGWLNRRRLAAGFARLRPIVLAELLVLLVVVGAVGTLTDLRPGSDRRRRRRSRRRRRCVEPPPAPPRGRVRRLRRQAGPLAVGFA